MPCRASLHPSSWESRYNPFRLLVLNEMLPVLEKKRWTQGLRVRVELRIIRNPFIRDGSSFSILAFVAKDLECFVEDQS